MPWIQLKLNTTGAHAEELSDALMEAGAVSITFQDTHDTPPVFIFQLFNFMREAGAEQRMLLKDSNRFVHVAFCVERTPVELPELARCS
jgi:ribosomal protein L11 methylase PrmA